MSDPAFDWETCKGTELTASRVVLIIERVAGENTAIAEELKDEIHETASQKMMTRGKRRAGPHYK